MPKSFWRDALSRETLIYPSEAEKGKRALMSEKPALRMTRELVRCLLKFGAVSSTVRS
jgi:hypothetical protein